MKWVSTLCQSDSELDLCCDLIEVGDENECKRENAGVDLRNDSGSNNPM